MGYAGTFTPYHAAPLALNIVLNRFPGAMRQAGMKEDFAPEELETQLAISRTTAKNLLEALVAELTHPS